MNLSTSGSSTSSNQQVSHQEPAPQTLASTSGYWTLPGNTITNPKEDLKGITTRSGVTIQGPKAVNHDTEVTKDTMPPANNGSTEDVQPPVVQIQSRNPNPEPTVAPVVTPIPKASIPFPSRRNDEKRKEKANDQIEKFYEIFRDLSFEISFTDALMLMPKFASTLKTLIGNKEKLSELARTPLNENCSAVILNKLPKKLGDPGRFLIPCEFTGITTCNALADLGASINLMPYSVWKDLALPELTPTCMTLELADRSITEPIGIAKDVRLMVGKFQFPADFVVVDFEPDPRVPLILGRCFLKTSHALIDVYGGEITLRVGKEAITFNLDQTSKYTADYDHMTANKIDVIEMACDEYSQEVLGFSNVIASGNPTPYFEPIVSTASPNLTPFGDSDFLLMEEADSFLALEDDPTSSEVDPTYQDPEGDILILEAILNTVESSVNEPPEVELKELPPHLEYAFLEGDDKLPVIIAKDLKDEEKAALLKVLKSHKRGNRLELSDIKGVSPEFCTHKILMEEDYETICAKVREGVHCVPKKGGMTVITNEENVLIPTRLVTGLAQAKVEVIAKLPHPTSVKGVRSFLGHAGFYRRFIQDFSKIARPMTHLLEKETPFFFSEECIDSFNTLKRKLTEAPILIAPDWDLPFELMCDASDFAIGAVLGQRKNKHFQPIHYASKTMNEAQTHYTTTEKELLAVVYAFEKFWSYLVMSKSIVYTDHSAIKYLFAKKDAKARLMRWILLLQEFDIEIRDKKGAENLAADHLSRLENPHQDKGLRVLEKPNEPPLPEGHTSGSGEGSMEHTFELMDIVPPTPYDSPLTGGYTPRSDEGRLKLKELMAMCIKLSKHVLDLEKENDAQAVEILKLKQRVKKLERKRKSSISHLRRRIYKQVESSDDDLDEEDASEQGRKSAKTASMFKDSDFDVLDGDMENVEGETVNTATTGVSVVSAPVTTAGVAISTAEPRTHPITAASSFIDEDLTIAQTLVKMRSEKEKEKGVAFRDVEETPRLPRSTTTLQPLPTIDPKDKEEATNAALAKEFDEIQARMDADHELAVRLTHEEQEKYTIEERATLLAEYFERRKKQLVAERAEAIRNKPPTRA
ncbi:reverse transcriptase domain-containing protein [Tanacetum coccineum]